MNEARRSDAAGRVFLSYRRSRAGDAEHLVRALRIHGVPTWQDVDDLGPHSTPAQIREALADPATSAAILWITPDLARSDFILDVEVPAIVERVRQRDGFFLQPVAAGGLEPREAGEIASNRLGLANLAHWNLMRVTSDPLDRADATRVARAVLRRRLEAIHAVLPAGAPLRLTLDTFRPTPFDPDRSLQMSWSRAFPRPRFPEPDAWAAELEPALRAITETIAAHCPGRPLLARGQLSLGAALALGRCFEDASAIPVTWEQYHRGAWADWSLSSPAEDSGVIVAQDEHGPSARDLALLVSAAHPVETAFGNTLAALPALRELRGVVHIRWPGAATEAAMTPGQGVDIARRVRRELSQARDRWRVRGGAVHVFISAPAGLAVLIGQQLNTFDPIIVYEHLEDSNTYAPALTLAGDTA